MMERKTWQLRQEALGANSKTLSILPYANQAPRVCLLTADALGVPSPTCQAPGGGTAGAKGKAKAKVGGQRSNLSRTVGALSPRGSSSMRTPSLPLCQPQVSSPLETSVAEPWHVVGPQQTFTEYQERMIKMMKNSIYTP